MDRKQPSEKDAQLNETASSNSDVQDRPDLRWQWAKKLTGWGVESRGILPVPLDERSDRQFFKIFFVWLSVNFNILSFSAGTLGPFIYGLGLRDSCLVILFFNLLCAAPPAYFATWGPRLGLRQIVQARFSFGYYGIVIPCVLNLITLFGFCILNSILGGQTLATMAGGDFSWSVGIVIITLISLFVSFCGIKILNWYERLAFLPILMTFLVAVGVSGHNLSLGAGPAAAPATAPQILSFGATIAGFVITYSGIGCDFTTYYDSRVPSWRLFSFAYLGFLVPIVPLQCLGAAASATAPSVASWTTGFEDGANVGGLVFSMLLPAGSKFAKFLTVLLALSVAGNVAATFYSIAFNIQLLVPKATVIPREVFSLISTAIVLPLAIVGSHRFYTTLTNFLGLIGYWAGGFIAIILVEHLAFRRRLAPQLSVANPSTPTKAFAGYDVAAWNDPRGLPTGIAALGALICGIGVSVLCMDQVWFVGPVAKTTGDIGFEVAFSCSALVYLILRTSEKKWRGI